MSLYVGGERYMQPRSHLDPDDKQYQTEVHAAQTARAKADGGLEGPRGDEVTYIIQPHDTLTSIAQTHGQDLDELIKNNAQLGASDKINANRILFLPKADAKTVEAHQALRDEDYLSSSTARHTESGADLAQARRDNSALWTKIEQSVQKELRDAGAKQLFPEKATAALLVDIKSRAPDFDHYQQVVDRAYKTVQKEWQTSAPTADQPARYSYDPHFDPQTEPELALRSELTARMFGGPNDSNVHLTPEEQYNVSTDKLAETLGGGNPIEESIYANLYGGKDPLTKQELKPLWEKMDMTREQLRKTLTEEPWKIASKQLGHEISKQDYEKLQSIDGPLGHLMNLGVDPKTALTLQATWSAHFYGGHDPITQSQLKPVWERWGLQSPDQLQDLFENDPGAAIALSDLMGGNNPATGKTTAPPWEGTSDAYGADNLKTAQSILGVDVLKVQHDVVPAGLWEPYALGLSTPAVRDQLKYENPAGLAQSPQIRNGTELKKFGQTAIATSAMDPLGAIGLFGLLIAKNPKQASAVPAPPVSTGDKPSPIGRSYQAHGFFQIYPGGDQESIYLFKAQTIPKLDKTQREEYRQKVQHEQTKYWVGQGESQSAATRKAEKYAKEQAEKAGASHFFKVQGSFTDAGGSAMVFLGKSDESDGSRARRPAIVGFQYGYGSDGSLNHVGGTLGGPLPAKSLPYWNASSLTVAFSKDSEGNWKMTQAPFLLPSFEGGAGRYQLYPSVFLDPDTGSVNGFSVWGGTGYHLGQLGYQQDNANPRMEVNLEADPELNGLGPNVAYSNPQNQSFQIGYMGGKNGKSAGFAFETGSSSDTKVTVRIGPEGVDGARDDAIALHDELNGDKPRTWTELPVGTGVTNSSFDTSTVRLMAFIKLFNFGGSYGNGLKTSTDIQRTGNDTWNVARYQETQNEYSALAGIIGIGYGGRSYNANLQGEGFEVTAQTGTDGKPVLDPKTQAAIDEYLQTGLFAGATSFEGRFQGKDGEKYQELRDDYQAARTELEKAPKAPATTAEPGEKSEADKVRDLQATYYGALEKLNKFCRDHIKPGEQVMPGLKLKQTTTRTTDGVSHSFVLPEFYSRERVTGEVKFEDHEIGSYELTRDWWFAPEVKQQYTDQTGKGPDSYTLSTQSEVKSHPPADWNKPVGVPYDIVKDVTTDAYLPMLDAVNAGKDVEVKGKLSVNLTAGQMLAIGASLNTGPDSQRLWNSFAARASTAFDGVNGADNLLTHAPEYFDNIGKQGIVDMYHLKLLQVRAEKAAEDNGVKWNDDLKKKFAEVSSPEQFRQLSEKERKLFTDVLLLTSSADHSPYEALAPLAVMQSDAPNAQPLISEDARSQAFEQIVKQFETMTFSPGNEPDWRKVAGPYENPDDRIYMEPTSELLRFVRDDQSSDAIKGMVFSQAGFQASLPESITKRLDDSKKDLEQEFKEEMQWKPVYSPKAGAPINYTRATNAASSLLAIASKEGSEAAWAVMDKYGIKAEDVLKLLSDYRSDKEMILKQALIDVLSPAAPAGQRTVFNAQQKEVDEWMKG